MEELPIDQLTSALKPLNTDNRPTRHVTTISDKQWERAQRLFKIIEPLLVTGRTRAMVEERAKEFGLDPSTVYNYLRAYERNDRITDLVRKERGDAGNNKLKQVREDLLVDLINTKYLTSQRLKLGTFIELVQKRFEKENLAPPDDGTIRRRIGAIPKFDRDKARYGAHYARNNSKPKPGHHRGGGHFLAEVQVDHFQPDVILVDDITREPIGQPWITVAIDVFSRIIVGFYISLDPPGAFAVGMCLANAMLSKEPLLRRYKITERYDVWGKIGTVHADNAREWRCKMLDRTADLYHIDLRWRRVKTPPDGAFVESLCDKLKEVFATLPGALPRDSRIRGDEDANERAVLTYDAFEYWALGHIVVVYHKSFHSGINMSPNDKMLQGIFGNETEPGTGLPDRFQDEQRVRLDFLPYFERVIQHYGVMLDYITYYDQVLDTYMDSIDPEDPRGIRKKRFKFSRDPRDISSIWFLDGDMNVYYRIPYQHIARPRISIWEQRLALRTMKALGQAMIDEDAIFAMLETLQLHVREEAAKTTAARRDAQRRRTARNTPVVPTSVMSVPELPGGPVANVAEEDDPDEEVPYEEQPRFSIKIGAGKGR